MSDSLARFIEEVLGVNPQYKNFNIFAPGASLPGMGGQAIATTGAANAGTDVVQHLRAAVIAFANAYAGGGTPEGVYAAAQKVEGDLMMMQTLSMLSEQKVDYLVNGLHFLMEEKYGTQHN